MAVRQPHSWSPSTDSYGAASFLSKFFTKRDFAENLKQARRIISEGGLITYLRAVKGYIIYHLHSKWHFVYLVFSLEQEIFSFNIREPISVRIATREDMTWIKSELFPYLTGDLAYEKRYFELLDHPRIKCFLAQKDGKLVHYSWVFVDVFESPLMKLPFDKAKLKQGDAYIGPIFTCPEARGFIYLHVLSRILCDLKENNLASRVIVLVERKSASAVSFYKRLGFREVVGAHRRSMFSFVREGLRAAF